MGSGIGDSGSSKWEKVFKKFDNDNGGSIDAYELLTACQSLGLKSDKN